MKIAHHISCLIKHKQVQGTFLFTLQALALNAISVPVMAYIIRTLGENAYGQWSVSVTLIGLVSFLTNLGLRMTLVRAIAQQPEKAGELVAGQLGLRLFLSLGAGGIALLICLGYGYPPIVFECTALAVIGLVLNAFNATLNDALQALRLLGPLAAIQFSVGLFLTVASVMAVCFHTGPVGLTFAYLLGPIASCIGNTIFARRNLFFIRVNWSIPAAIELLKEARKFNLQGFVVMLGGQAEALMIPKLLGIAQFGFFSAGTLVPNRLGIINEGLVTSMYPALAQGYSAGVMQLRKVVARYIVIALLINLPPAVVLYALAPWISGILFPAKAEMCQHVIRITVWCLPLVSVGSVLGYTLAAAQAEAEQTRALIFSYIVGFLLSAYLIIHAGLVGACWAMVLRHSLCLLSFAPATWRILKNKSFLSVPIEAEANT